MSHPREILLQLLERQRPEPVAGRGAAHAADRSAACPRRSPGALLAALSAKGVVVAEVRGFAQAMRRLARRPRSAARPARHRHRRHRRGCLGEPEYLHRDGAAHRGLRAAGHQARQPLGLEPLRQCRRARGARACRAAGCAGRRATASPPPASPSCSRPTTTPRPRRSPRCAPRSGCARCSISSGRW